MGHMLRKPSKHTLNAENLGFTNGRGYVVTDLFDDGRMILIINFGYSFIVEVDPSGVRFSRPQQSAKY